MILQVLVRIDELLKQLRMKQKELNGIFGEGGKRIGVHTRYVVFFPGGFGEVEVSEVVTPRVRVMRMRDSRLAMVLAGLTAKKSGGEFHGFPRFMFQDKGHVVFEWWRDGDDQDHELDRHVMELRAEGIILHEEEGVFHDDKITLDRVFMELDSMLEELGEGKSEL